MHQPLLAPWQLHELEQLRERLSLRRGDVLRAAAKRRDAVDPAGELQREQLDLGPPEENLLVRRQTVPAARVVRLEDVRVLRPKRREPGVGVGTGATRVGPVREVRKRARNM